MDKSTATSKQCPGCDVIKPLDDYYRSKAALDGRQPQCKACDLARQRSRRKQPMTDRMAEARRAARAAVTEAGVKQCIACDEILPLTSFQRRDGILDGYNNLCKGCRASEKAAAYRKDPKKHNAKTTAAYYANREKYLASVREWQLANRDLRREYEHRRRARKANARVGTVRADDLWTGFCALCGAPIDPDLRGPDPMSKSLDHIIPLARGGTHEQLNLQWSHLRCNIRKGARA